MQEWILRYALEGIASQRSGLDRDEMIVREMLEPKDVLPVAKPVKVKLPKAVKKKPDQFAKDSSVHKNKRNMSPEARERIASAQRKRWAAARAAKAA